MYNIYIYIYICITHRERGHIEIIFIGGINGRASGGFGPWSVGKASTPGAFFDVVGFRGQLSCRRLYDSEESF